MKKTLHTTLFFLSAFLIIGSGKAYADNGYRNFDASDLLIGIATGYLVLDTARDFSEDRIIRSRHDRGYYHDSRNSSRIFDNGHDNSYSRKSVTSEPIRGGSSRRTRLVTNPYPNRALRGISFTGIDRGAFHINDIITYPSKRLISRRGYSLSLFEPSQFLNTRGYVDYIALRQNERNILPLPFITNNLFNPARIHLFLSVFGL